MWCVCDTICALECDIIKERKRAGKVLEIGSKAMHSCRQYESSCYKFREVLPVVLPNVDTTTDANARVVKGDEVLTFRKEECGTQMIVVNTAQIPRDFWRPARLRWKNFGWQSVECIPRCKPGMERNALQTERSNEMHLSGKSGQRVAGLRKLV